MKTQLLKKISALCLVLVISGAAWACGGKGGGCGDKDKKDASVFTAQCDGSKKADSDKKGGCDKKAEGQGGCKGADSGSKECPKK
jgi:hypothetical protein